MGFSERTRLGDLGASWLRQIRFVPRDIPGSTVCHFFFKDTEEQKSLKHALSALLHQLFISNHFLAEACEGTINSQGAMVSSDVTGLWKVFTEATKQDTAHQIICVLDALDECDPADFPTLVRFLRGYSSIQKAFGDAKPRVKFLATTRGYPEIIDELLDFESTIVHLSGDSKDEKDQIQKEIELVMDTRLAKLSDKKKLSDERQSLIREALQNSVVQSEQRTYLWVSLLFEVLERNFDDRRSQWQKLISNPPKTVFSAYARLLESVSLVDKNRVRVLLNLIIAAERPLTLQEMNPAIHLRERERNGINSEADLDLMPENNFRKWLIQACGFFVTEYNKKVFFIHQTAKEFLLRDICNNSGDSVEIDEWQNSVTFEQAHQSMAESCIAYLTLNDFASSSFRRQLSEFLHTHLYYRSANGGEFCLTFSQYKLLDYATSHWTRHFQSAQQVEGEDTIDVGPKYNELYWSLFDGGDTVTKPWLAISELVQNPKGPFHYRLVDALILHLAVLHGQYADLELLVNYGVDINGVDIAGLTALHYFVVLEEEKYLNMSKAEEIVEGVKFLVRSGSKYSARKSGSLLYLAVAEAWESSTPPTIHGSQLDVDHGADDLDEAYHRSFIKLLVDHDEDVNYKNHLGYTPLHLACETGLTWHVLCLLKSNADPNVKGNLGNSLLDLVCGGHAEEGGMIASALVQHGAYISPSGTPFMFACD
ncbi:ankyrin repeat-containing protein [Colletotrichum plurivorum]|uniref:Ankyrin repeat-containing protein n=1 Tax=Colletotrichum plurivorum TaxID=2175906 RepID=A0A8H6JXL2_9PEZI|nr:ankyrin repeat-containing protein [Colletotrichum plurivorum]